MPSFHVDGRVSVKLDYDFAMRLGDFILSSGTGDKQFLALGHKLTNLDEEEPSSKFVKNKDFYEEKEIIKASGNLINGENYTDYHQKTPIKVRSFSKYSK